MYVSHSERVRCVPAAHSLPCSGISARTTSHGGPGGCGGPGRGGGPGGGGDGVGGGGGGGGNGTHLHILGGQYTGVPWHICAQYASSTPGRVEIEVQECDRRRPCCSARNSRSQPAPVLLGAELCTAANVEVVTAALANVRMAKERRAARVARLRRASRHSR